VVLDQGDYLAALPIKPLSNLKPDPVKANWLAERLTMFGNQLANGITRDQSWNIWFYIE
jgi:hypothetical protein